MSWRVDVWSKLDNRYVCVCENDIRLKWVMVIEAPRDRGRSLLIVRGNVHR